MELGNGVFLHKRLSPVILSPDEKKSIYKTALEKGIKWFDIYIDVEKSLGTA
jgi:hypothetical protein